MMFILLFSFFTSAAVMTTTGGTATTTSTQALPINKDRAYLIVQNRGDVDLHVKTQTAHGVGEVGIVIAPGGNWEPYNPPIDRIFLKSESGTANYTVMEGP